MKRFYHIFSLSLLSLLFLPSCAGVEEDNGLVADGDQISFHAGFPGVTTSRTTYDISAKLLSDGFSVTAFCPEDDPIAGGILDYHCKGVIVNRRDDYVFRSDGCKWPSNAKKKHGSLKFFAYHPSIDSMRTRAGVGNQYFAHYNGSKKDASGVSYDYRLTKFRVAPDISKQVDFVTSIGEGNKTDNLYSGVELYFEHQLSGVEISAWGGSSLYDIEVAGVRIGGIVVEADFSLSTVAENPGDDNTFGQWIITSQSPRGYVDYVFAPGNNVVKINSSEHNTKATAVSIMGRGGKAMVIPQKQAMWDHTNDKTTTPKGMYFSALVRITRHDGDQHCIFPSTDPQSRNYLVYLMVRKSDGMVMKRLTADQYESDTYVAPAGQEKRAYGWAAAPATVDWTAGYTYSYVLDYTNGVGVHDPYDPNPGAPMIDWGGVEVTATTGKWSDGGTIGEGSWGANSNNTAPDGTVWWK